MDIRKETACQADEDAGSLPRPWETPGMVRRDCDPHRGPLLLILGYVSIVCGLLGCFLLFPAIPGVIVGALGYRMARADQAKMRAGLIDRDGRKETQAAERLNAIGIGLTLFTGIISGFMMLFVFLIDYRRR